MAPERLRGRPSPPAPHSPYFSVAHGFELRNFTRSEWGGPTLFCYGVIMVPTPVDLEAAVAPVVRGLGFDLVEVQQARAGKKRIVRILADRPTGGIGLDECARISRALAVALEEAGLGREPYVLEVSSPGLDYRLSKPEDFRRYVGEALMLHLTDGAQVEGALKEVNDAGLWLDGRVDPVPFAQVRYGTRKY
jgi:ribosome maturation factor RimP